MFRPLALQNPKFQELQGTDYHPPSTINNNIENATCFRQKERGKKRKVNVRRTEESHTLWPSA